MIVRGWCSGLGVRMLCGGREERMSLIVSQPLLKRGPGRPRPPRWRAIAGAAASAALGAGLPARADDNPVILQWFETRWDTMEYRIPDFFIAGYDGVWIPPVSRCSDPSSAGYDPFDRFDLGSPSLPTAYGTEAFLRATIAEFHRAGAQVYVDAIMNHNSARTSNPAFLAAGGWPGFYLPASGPDFWG